MLTLPEQLMLIALTDQKGTVLFTAASVIPYSLIGATLTELFLSGRIELQDEKVHVINEEKTGRALCDEIFDYIKSAKSERDLKNWLLKIDGHIKDIKEKTLEHLVLNKVLGKEKSKFLGLFSKTIYPTINPQPEKELRSNIKKFILEKENPDEMNVALLILVQASQLLEDIFTQEEIKDAKTRITELIERSHEGDAIKAETAYFLRHLYNAMAEASGTSGSI